MKNKNITLTVLGGGKEIGANCYLLEWGDYNILLDAGLDPKKKGYTSLPYTDKLYNKTIDAIIITHAHLDHIGSLPILFIDYSNLNTGIFMTPPNTKLIPHMLMESVKNVERERISPDEQYYYHQYFNRTIINKIKKYFKPFDYGESFEVCPSIKGFFFQSGHLLGSAGIMLSDGNYRFVYTGDICKKDQILLEGCQIDSIKDIDCLLIESTNGNDTERTSPNQELELESLAKEIRQTKKRGGHVLIPCFALGRTQEILIALELMKEKDMIDQDMPIYYHVGITEGINRIYDNFSSMMKNIEDRNISTLSKSINCFNSSGKFESIANKINEPSIFVFTGGMLSRGSPGAFLAEELIQSEKNSIFFVGYVAPNELGYELLHSKIGQYVCVDLEKQRWVPVRCPNIKKFRLSAHAYRDELLSIAKSLNPKIILWVHGDEVATENLKKEYEKREKNIKSYAPANRESIILRDNNKKVNIPYFQSRAVIITVGTSLITTYLQAFEMKYQNFSATIDEESLKRYVIENLHCLPRLSAEINSLNKMELQKTDMLYFICGDNKEGRLCGEIISELYRDNYMCRLIQVKGLRPDDKPFKEEGMKKLISSVLEIIEKHGTNSVIHATGGFKAQIAIATLIGILFQIDVYYLYENFQDVVRLPDIPIGFDYNTLFAYKTHFFQLLDGREYWKVDEIYQRLPDRIKVCFYKDPLQKKYNLTPLGRGGLDSALRYMEKRMQQVKIEVKGYSSLWGKECDSIKKILNPVIGMIIERILRVSELIEKLEFSSKNIKKNINNMENNEIFLELIKITPNSLTYYVNHSTSSLDRIQDIMTIHVVSGTASYLLQMIGRKIYL